MIKSYSERSWVLLALVLGLALRLDFLVASSWVIDSDEAIVGLMAKHIADGGAWPTFYYGQHYMGTLEPILAAGLFKIVGVGAIPLKLVPLCFSLLLIPLTGALARACGGGRWAGRGAMLLCAVAPSPLIIWSAMARGGFIEIVVISALALLLTARWLSRRPSVLLTLGIGLLLGFGWWTNNQIVFAMGPIGLCMLLRLWRSENFPFGPILIHGVVGLLAFVAGGAPFWIYNLNHHFISFEMFGAAGEGKLLDQIADVFRIALPILLGAKRFWQTEDIFFGSSWLVGAVYAVVFLSALSECYRRRSLSLRSSGWIGESVANGMPLVLLFIVSAISIFAVSSFGWLVTAPRYLLPLYPAIFAVVAVTVERLGYISKKLSVLCIAGFLSFHLISCYVGGRAIPGQPFVAGGERVAIDHHELLDFLTEKNIRFIETNYWIGYRVAFESKERVRFRVFGEPPQVRIREYQDAAEAANLSDVALVLVPSQYPSVAQAMNIAGVTYEYRVVSGYIVVFNRHPTQEHLQAVPSSELLTATAVHPEVAPAMLDGDASTRWGSAHPQSPGMEVRVMLSEAKNLRALHIEWSRWPTDYPRGLEISTTDGEGDGSLLLSSEDYQKIKGLVTRSSQIDLFFPSREVKSIILRQTGSDPKFDWSIAEIKAYQ